MLEKLENGGFVLEMKRLNTPRWHRVWLIGLLALVLAALAGCGRSDNSAVRQAEERGYHAGFEQGEKAGYRRGVMAAERALEWRWGWIGLLAGGSAGLGLVTLFRWRAISEEKRRRRNRREVERLVKQCDIDLDDALHREVTAIGRKRAALEEKLSQDESPLVREFRERLGSCFRQMDDQLIRLATLLQQLRHIQENMNLEPRELERQIRELEGDRGGTCNADERQGLEAAIEAKRRTLTEVMTSQSNIRRCEHKLAALDSFLDHLTMRLGNLKTVEEYDAFTQYEGEVGKELDGLQETIQRTLSELASPLMATAPAEDAGRKVVGA